MIEVELFGKEGCSLCFDVLAMLRRLQAEIPFDLTVTEIVPGTEIFERYQYTVPVIHIQKVHAFAASIDEERVRNTLQSLL